VSNLLRSFVHSLNWVCFLIVDFKSSLYILDNSSLSDMGFASIFFQSGIYFLTLLIMRTLERAWMWRMYATLVKRKASSSMWPEERWKELSTDKYVAMGWRSRPFLLLFLLLCFWSYYILTIESMSSLIPPATQQCHYRRVHWWHFLFYEKSPLSLYFC
jgi:hypothetical protein